MRRERESKGEKTTTAKARLERDTEIPREEKRRQTDENSSQHPTRTTFGGRGEDEVVEEAANENSEGRAGGRA